MAESGLDTQLTFALLSIAISTTLSAIIALMLDKRKGREELRKEHFEAIKKEVLLDMLKRLDEFGGLISSNMYGASGGPQHLTNLGIPQSKLYEVLPIHFAEICAIWEDYRGYIQEWSKKCMALYSSIGEPIVNYELENGSTILLFSLHRLHEDLYYSLFAGKSNVVLDNVRTTRRLTPPEQLKLELGLPIPESDSYDVQYENMLSVTLSHAQAESVAAMITRLRSLAEESTALVHEITLGEEELDTMRNKVESAIREGLASLMLSGKCRYCASL